MKDVDLVRRRIHVRDGKGGKGRFTVLPDALRDAIADQVTAVRRRHRADASRGDGYVTLPDAFDRKAGGALRDWRWAWVFPAAPAWYVYAQLRALGLAETRQLNLRR